MAGTTSTSTRRLRFFLEVSRVSLSSKLKYNLVDIVLVYQDPEPSSDEGTEQLKLENEQLRGRIAALERELTGRSPTKKSRSRNVLASSCSSNTLGRESDIEMALSRMDQLKLTDTMVSPQSGATGKKQRKMTTRKWDLAPEEDL